MGTTTVCPGTAVIASGMVSDGFADTGVGVGVGVAVGVGVGVGVASVVGVGVGTDIRIEPSCVVPSSGIPLSFPYIAGGSDENPTPASARPHDAPAVTMKGISIITPSGIATGVPMTIVSLRTASISPSVSSRSRVTFVTSNVEGAIRFTESVKSSSLASVESTLRHDSS